MNFITFSKSSKMKEKEMWIKYQNRERNGFLNPLPTAVAFTCLLCTINCSLFPYIAWMPTFHRNRGSQSSPFDFYDSISVQYQVSALTRKEKLVRKIAISRAEMRMRQHFPLVVVQQIVTWFIYKNDSHILFHKLNLLITQTIEFI